MTTKKTKEGSELNKALGRLLTNTYYNFQSVRIAFMNQIRDVVRKKNEGIAFDKVEEKKDEKTYDKKYKDENLIPLMNKLLIDEKIDNDEYEYFIKCYDLIKGPTINKMLKCNHCERKTRHAIKSGGVAETEIQAQNMLQTYIKTEPIWDGFLKHIKGIGYVLAANLIKTLGYCEKADTVSKLWAFCGYHVVNGKAPMRTKGEKLSYSVAVKTMVWKVSDSLMKINKGYYRALYDKEKHKQLTKLFEPGYLHSLYQHKKKDEEESYVYPPNAVQLSKGHAHARALRKMVKHFLSHYWECARKIVNLPTEKTYVESVLKHQHIISYKKAIEQENSYKRKVD